MSFLLSRHLPRFREVHSYVRIIFSRLTDATNEWDNTGACVALDQAMRRAAEAEIRKHLSTHRRPPSSMHCRLAVCAVCARNVDDKYTTYTTAAKSAAVSCCIASRWHRKIIPYACELVICFSHFAVGLSETKRRLTDYKRSVKKDLSNVETENI